MVCYWCVLYVVGDVVWGKHNRSNTFKKIHVRVAAISMFWNLFPGL